jgi:hypothetical protein
MVEFRVGQIVTVGPNLRSIEPKDHAEEPWKGRIEYVTKHSVGVCPITRNISGRYGRDVLKERVS